jgi:hypothetical protein
MRRAIVTGLVLAAATVLFRPGQAVQARRCADWMREGVPVEEIAGRIVDSAAIY